MKTESLPTRLEILLERKFEIGLREMTLTGSSTPLALSYLLSQTSSKTINDLPHLVVVPSEADALQFQQELEFFDPHRHAWFLPAFDVSPFSGLDPSPQVRKSRLQFLAKAARAKPGEIFLATADGLSQNTLPYSLFTQRHRVFKKGDTWPEDFSTYLSSLGYESSPMVEDVGQFAVRGGLVDIFSPAEPHPIRIELFGDQIESLRSFSEDDQRSLAEVTSLELIPAREAIFVEEEYEKTLKRFREDLEKRGVTGPEAEEAQRSLWGKILTPNLEFYLPFMFAKLENPLAYFSTPLNVWVLAKDQIEHAHDEFLGEWKADYNAASSAVLRPDIDKFLTPKDKWPIPEGGRHLEMHLLEEFTGEESSDKHAEYRTTSTQDLASLSSATPFGTENWYRSVGVKLKKWRDDGYRLFFATRNVSSQEKIFYALERMDLLAKKAATDDYLWDTWMQEQDADRALVHLIPRTLPESLRFEEERVVFLREDDLFGKKERRRSASGSEDFQKQARRLSFGDLKPGDLVVHVLHGIGQYEGLKIMPIGGADSEFIQISYKDKDKLYLPVYRVGQLQKYSAANVTTVLDKLGGPGWEKTKSKVKGHLRELAGDLLQLYARRAEAHRPSFKISEQDTLLFEKSFPYEETDDQLRAIQDIRHDLSGTKPMDRLICGDVGFGKTEVAMRAAFFAIQDGKQVAVIAPTTVLTFQHMETFKKRFNGWPVEIRVLNRFVSNAEAKKTIQDAADGKVSILIGTHRLFSKDVKFKDLGLLIVDEEQKFGVAHKEKIRKMKVSVDTLTLSATPIPRTLNMGLVGIRDLSLINSAPVDRLPTRTFICKFEPETIRKAVLSEIARGGQIYFIHNRIQSIYGLADEIRQIVPEARIRVGHGQMPEEELEKTMLAFFSHEIDILVCTAIVESGMDVPRANTMFIDRADLFGLSQLYQLRGRVGRSKLRAYCYLILPKGRKLDPDAQERLKVIQENTALGSGIKIAQYDLELRGAGSLLGEEQSGHIDSVGYELYMDLLQQALAEARGEDTADRELDPEINLRIPALIPDAYIGDIRIRLSYYKALADIESEDDLTRIEEELRDQFGDLPEPLLNLMGLMLIRRQCKDLGVRDVSAGVKNVSLVFTERTKLKPETVIGLAMRENKKYSITPDNRLNIRMNTMTWMAVHEELKQLLRLI